MSVKTQNKVFLFMTYLTTQDVKDQLIWIYIFSRINTLSTIMFPVFEVLIKTNTKAFQLKNIVLKGNQYLQSIEFGFNISIENDNIKVEKLKTIVKKERKRPTVNEVNQLIQLKYRELIDEVIEHLNLCAGTEFDSSKPIYYEPIIARAQEGYTKNQFFHVIEVKCHQWLKSPEMSANLRPQTLFSPKMDGYIDEKIIIKQTTHQDNEHAANTAITNIFSANPQNTDSRS